MPRYEFMCKNDKCHKEFEEICTFSEFDAGFPDVECPECHEKNIEKKMSVSVNVLNSTDKMNNFEYAAQKNFDKAQQFSASAREEAQRKGITSPYADLPDFTDNGRRMNFVD